MDSTSLLSENPSSVDACLEQTLARLSLRSESLKLTGSDRKRRLDERLKAQKEARFDYQQVVRELASQMKAQAPVEEMEEPRKGVKRKAEEMTPDPTSKEMRQRKLDEQFREQLMIPEILVDEFPDDLEEKWICVPYPTGRRCLVVASNSRTCCRLRDGSLHSSFQSFLPGGSRSANPKEYCVLDCILLESSFTFHVLDIMAWKSNLYYNCEAEFRSYWLQSKFSEESDLGIICKQNPFRFLALEHFASDLQTLKKLNTTQNQNFFLYHRGGHYALGESPLMIQTNLKLFSKFVEKLESQNNQEMVI